MLYTLTVSKTQLQTILVAMDRVMVTNNSSMKFEADETESLCRDMSTAIVEAVFDHETSIDLSQLR